MKKKLYIHIGVHKTATTLLQTTFEAHTKELLKQGIWYERREGYDLGSIMMNESPFSLDQIQEYKNTFSDIHARDDIQKIFWSCEGFVGDFADGYAKAETMAKDLASITKDYDVTLIATLRRQDSFIESAYQQMVKQAELSDFSAFRQRVNIKAFDWYTLLNLYKNHFPDAPLHVFAYEVMLSDQAALMGSILAVMDASLAFEVNQVSNPSLSPTGMFFAKMLSCVPGHRVRGLLRKVIEKAFPRAPGESLGIVSNALRFELLSHYQESNQTLFNEMVEDQTWRDYYTSTR